MLGEPSADGAITTQASSGFTEEIHDDSDTRGSVGVAIGFGRLKKYPGEYVDLTSNQIENGRVDCPTRPPKQFSRSQDVGIDAVAYQ